MTELESICACRWTLEDRMDVHGAMATTFRKVVRFQVRCELHTVMCRGLEQWEMDLEYLQEHAGNYPDRPPQQG